jgi:heparanase 1
MKLKIITFIPVISFMFFFTACNSGYEKTGSNSDSNTITVNIKEMKQIGTVSDRFQSYNVEMVEVVGGKFWKPYKLMDSLPSAEAASGYDISQNNDQMYRKVPEINLTDKRLLNLAKGLAPAYVRVSGTWANATYFQDDDKPAAKVPTGYVNVLTRKQWKGVIDFIKATNSQLVTSFAVSNGVRDKNGIWTPVNAQKLVNYTKTLGGSVAAAELFNEPNIPTAGGEMNKDYNLNTFAKDLQVFTIWAKKEVPGMLRLGPGAIGDGLPGISLDEIGSGATIFSTEGMLTTEPKPVFDGFSYHYYGAASMRMMKSGPFSIQAENALDSVWLTKTDAVADFYKTMRDKYQPGKPLWLTETAEAAAGGDPFAATYLDCFRYLYQLGSLAKKGVQVVMHNTLAASEYSLIDQDTHLPKPNYWAALLWAKLMGTEVYEAGENKPGVYLFAHNTKGKEGSITLHTILQQRICKVIAGL